LTFNVINLFKWQVGVNLKLLIDRIYNCPARFSCSVRNCEILCAILKQLLIL